MELNMLTLLLAYLVLTVTSCMYIQWCKKSDSISIFTFIFCLIFLPVIVPLISVALVFYSYIYLRSGMTPNQVNRANEQNKYP